VAHHTIVPVAAASAVGVGVDTGLEEVEDTKNAIEDGVRPGWSTIGTASPIVDPLLTQLARAANPTRAKPPAISDIRALIT